MEPERVMQLILAFAGIGFITFGETYFDAIGVTLMIWSNNFDYKKEM